MKTRIEIRLVFFVSLILALILAACAPSAEAPESEAAESGGAAPAAEAAEAGEDEGYQPPSAETGGAIAIDAADPCAIVTQEQVSAAFGKNVVEINTDTQSIGMVCEYAFVADYSSMLQINIYSGEAAKHYFAGVNEALQEGCEAYFDKIFDVAFGQSPDSGQDVSGLSLGDLYTTYVGNLGDCMFVQNQTPTDIGENVITAETIYLNSTSNVAVLGEDKVVEFTYQEPIPNDVQTELQSTTDKVSFYAAAQPYRDTVLAGYTEKMIGLLQEATAQ